MNTFEANFDGLVGPTHNHAGLSYGNVASVSHGGEGASPRAAALQGLRKMKAMADLGLVQFLTPGMTTTGLRPGPCSRAVRL